MSTVRETLLSELAAHPARDERERRSLARTRAMLGWLRSPFDQEADPAHVTASAIVLAPDGCTLLHRHKRLGIWLQPGGHLDPGEDPGQAAVRETREETGLSARHPEHGPQLVHVDVHEGPRGHVHLDLRYLLTADAATELMPGVGESPDVAWFPTEEVAGRFGDASLAAAITAARRWRDPR